MKTNETKKLQVFMLVTGMFLFLLSGCTKDLQTSPDAKLLAETALLKKNGMREIPLKLDFYSRRNYTMSPSCEGAYFGVYQVGEGTGTSLGNFSVTGTFCMNANFEYINAELEFVASNGDKLFMLIANGVVLPLPYNDPLYEFYFQDKFIITGGTGRFEGASGSGYTDSYLDLFVDGDPNQVIAEHQTDHKFTGTLILPGE